MKLIELQFPSPSFPLSRSLDRDLLAFVAHTNTWLRLVPPQRSLLIRRIGHTQVSLLDTHAFSFSLTYLQTRAQAHTHTLAIICRTNCQLRALTTQRRDVNSRF